LIVTGTNIASQNLLFEQLSESLQQFSQSKFVRLRSSEATTLKATLKKVIRDATDRSSGDEDDEDDDDLQVSAGQDVSTRALHL
jgi:origin recognition complex subunit 3